VTDTRGVLADHQAATGDVITAAVGVAGAGALDFDFGYQPTN